MKLTWQLINGKHKPAFALGMLVMILTLLGGIELWQSYNYQKQMQLYQEISREYQMKIAENEIKIQMLSDSNVHTFYLKGMDITVDNGTIIFKFNTQDIIERKFILPQQPQP